MANSKLNKIVTKVMDDIQDGTTKCEHCPYCGEKIIYTKNKITGNMVPCRCKFFHADAHRRDCISVSCLPSFAVWTASGGGLPSLGAGRRQIRSVPVSGKLSSLGPYWPEVGAV